MLGFIVSPFLGLIISSSLLESAHTLFIAGILHNASDLSRMSSYVNRGSAGAANVQYNDYLLLSEDSFSSATYVMSEPVVTLTSRAAFEEDATAAYQNALVRHYAMMFLCCADINY